MSWREPVRCFEETQGHAVHASAVAPRGMTTPLPPQIHESTLDLHLLRGWHKVVAPSDEEINPRSFFFSGKTGYTNENAKSGMHMVQSMPSVDDLDADFNIVFRNVKLNKRTFEENTHLKTRGTRGEGVSGCVTAHEDTTTKVPFVRKKIKDGTKLRREELMAMLAVHHPGICSLYGLMVHNGTADILMQDAGHPLRDFLTTIIQKNVSSERYWAVVTDLTVQGFEAICEMHQRSVYHLDIKPENYLAHLNKERRPTLVLADFGSALIGPQQMDLRLQLTPEYMAPELWQIYKRKGRTSGSPGDQVRASFDTYALGLTVYFMCTLRHLLLEVLKRKDEIIHPDEVQEFAKGQMDLTFAFKFLLMTEHPDCIPFLASTGPWIFPQNPPPARLVEVIKRTLDPNPDTRWTERDVISFLTEKPVQDRNMKEEEAVFKTPTQATEDNGVSLEDNLQQVLTLRPEASAAGPVVEESPISHYQAMTPRTHNTDVRNNNAQLLGQQYSYQQVPYMQVEDDAGNDSGLGRATQVCYAVDEESEMDHDTLLVQSMRRNQAQLVRRNHAYIVDMEEESMHASAVAGGKPEVDMDMHGKVVCQQADVPDPQPPFDESDMDNLKKQLWPVFTEPNTGQGAPQPLGAEGGFACMAGTEGLCMFQLGAIGVMPKLKVVGPPTMQPPPASAIMKDSGMHCPMAMPIKHGGKKGKHAASGAPYKRVAQPSMKAGSGAYGKNLAFLSQEKKMLVAEDVTCVNPPGQMFFVGSSTRRSLAPRVIPSPPLNTGGTALLNGSTPNVLGQSTLQQPITCTSPATASTVSASTVLKMPPASFNPWAVGDEVCRGSVQSTTSPGAQSGDQMGECGDGLSREGAKGWGINMPNFEMLDLNDLT